MRRHLAVIVFAVLGAAPAAALDLPARKPGLWQLDMTFVGRKLPPQSIKECLDAATDKLMNANVSGAGAGVTCSKQEISRSGATHHRRFGLHARNGATVTSHAVVTGSFDSAYTVDVTSTRTGGPPMPGAAPGGTHESHTTIAAKWLGPCAARPARRRHDHGQRQNREHPRSAEADAGGAEALAVIPRRLVAPAQRGPSRMRGRCSLALDSRVRGNERLLLNAAARQQLAHGLDQLGFLAPRTAPRPASSDIRRGP